MTNDKHSYLRRLYESGKILIASPDLIFNPDYQINPDGINLRLHPLAYRLKSEKDLCIDILDRAGNNDRHSEPIEIGTKGLRLKPNEVLLGRTLETVSIESDKLLGLVFGRATLAGFGLSITFNQSKFPPYYPWSFPLQIKNNLSCDVMIYPYIYIAQLLVVEFPLEDIRGPKYPPYQGNPFMSVNGEEREKVDTSLDLHERKRLVAAKVNTEGAAQADIRRQREKFAKLAEQQRLEEERQRKEAEELAERQRQDEARRAEEERRREQQEAEKRAERMAVRFRYPFSGILHLLATGLVAVSLPFAASDFKAQAYDHWYAYLLILMAALALEYSHYFFKKNP